MFVFSPDIILCGWVGSKHQLTNDSDLLRALDGSSFTEERTLILLLQSLLGNDVGTQDSRKNKQTNKTCMWESVCEPSQPQGITTSGLKTNISLSPRCYAHKSQNHKMKTALHALPSARDSATLDSCPLRSFSFIFYQSSSNTKWGAWMLNQTLTSDWMTCASPKVKVRGLRFMGRFRE